MQMDARQFHHLLRGVTCATLLMSAAMGWAESSLPDLPLSNLPTPAPAWPTGFENFTPPVGATGPATGTPEIAEFTRTAGPGDALVVSGNTLSAVSGSDSGRDTRYRVYAQGTGLSDAAINRQSGDLAALSLPSTLPTWSTYLLWAENAQGPSRPVAINRTEAWWAGPDIVDRGDVLAIHGRNLAHSDGITQAWLYVQPSAGGTGRWFACSQVNPCRVAITIPTDFATGDYRVWAHNGHGGTYGWSRPINVTIVPTRVWSTSKIVDVTTFGANGSDNADDTAAIRAALNGIAVGSTLRFPAGRFLVNSAIYIPPHIRFQGAGKDTTTITNTTTFGRNSLGLIECSGAGNEWVDLGIVGDNNMFKEWSSMISFRDATDQRFRRVKISSAGWTNDSRSNLMEVTRTKRTLIEDCDIITSYGIFGAGIQQMRITGTRFRGHGDGDSNMMFWSAHQVSVMNCVAENLNKADEGNGYFKGRFVAGGYGGWDYYIGGNTTKDMVPGPRGDQNSGEQIMLESLGTTWRGQVSSAGANDVASTTLNYDPTGTTVVVVAGRGFGQSRRVSGWNASAKRIAIAEPWTVIPDSSSRLMIGNYLDRFAVYDNDLDGRPDYADTASSGVQPYGGSVNVVVRRNRFNELGFGIRNWSLSNGMQPQEHPNDNYLQPNYFNLFADNTMTACGQAIGQVVLTADTPPEDRTIVGAMYRRNTSDGATYGAAYTGGGNILFTVFDRNTLGNCPKGFVLNDDRHSVLLDNTINRGSATPAGPGISLNAANVVCLRDNTWTGFTTAYAGAPPGPILELPQRVVVLQAAAGGTVSTPVRIWNAGTANQSWAVTSDSTWLTLSPSSGTTASERAEGVVTMTAKTTGLSNGAHQAIVTVTAGTQVRKMTVRLSVGGTTTNTPPTISGIADRTVNEDAATGAVAFTVSDAQTAAGSLTVSATSSNATLVPTGGMVLGGSGANRTVTVTPAANKNGTATITLTVSDGSQSTSEAFVMTVTSVNDAPVVTTPIPDQLATVGTAFSYVAPAATFTDVDHATLTWSATGVPAGISFTPATRTFAGTPTTAGSATVTVTASDGSLSVNDSFMLTVRSDSSGTPMQINFQPASAPTVSGWLVDSGLVFGARAGGLTYGWNVALTATRDRNNPDSPNQQRDTLIHTQQYTTIAAVWEIVVPNGLYEVRLMAGDPNYFRSVYAFTVEGTLLLSGTPTSATRWIEATNTVRVSDGRLTVRNAASAVNNKLNFIEITPIPAGSN